MRRGGESHDSRINQSRVFADPHGVSPIKPKNLLGPNGNSIVGPDGQEIIEEMEDQEESPSKDHIQRKKTDDRSRRGGA